MPTLHAVIDTCHVQEGAWIPLPKPPWPPYVRLHGAMTDADVALLVAVRVGVGNETDHPPTPAEIAAYGPSYLPGGLAAIDGDTRIDPSCCCGLEDWRDWRRLLEEGRVPDLGHDPSPLAKPWEDGFRIFPDEEQEGKLSGSIFFTRDELEKALREVEIDLRGALEALEKWARVHIPEEAGGVVAAFAATFHLQIQALNAKGTA